MSDDLRSERAAMSDDLRSERTATSSDGVVLVGGSGSIGRALTPLLRGAGTKVTVLDRHCPLDPDVGWVECDLLVDDVLLPPGDVVVLPGADDSGGCRPWRLALDLAVTAARLARP